MNRYSTIAVKNMIGRGRGDGRNSDLGGFVRLTHWDLAEIVRHASPMHEHFGYADGGRA